MTVFFKRKTLFLAGLASIVLVSTALYGGQSWLMTGSQATENLDMSQLDMSHDPFVAKQTQAEMYRCPMHPHIVQDHPGNCPICGMNLEKVETVAALKDGAEPKGNLQERAAVKINATRQQLIGVKTAQVQEKVAYQPLRTVARVETNTERYAHIHTKYEGWIEEIFVRFVGQQVKAGQALFRLYSPELVAAQREYLSAKEGLERLQNEALLTSLQQTESMAARLLEAAEEKLKLYDLTPAQIAELESSGVPQRTVTVYAQHSGVVTQLDAVAGMRVTAGMTLYTLANLDTVWVQGKVYESDIARVEVGQWADVELPFLPGQHLRGRVSYIDPILDAQTRTANVRVVLANPQQRLKPNMFAHLTLNVGSGRRQLTVPAAAVIDTGREQFVFVVGTGGSFYPTPVTVGERLGADYALLKGPDKGTKVLTDAQFLVDAESQLQAVIQQMRPAQRTAATDGESHAGH